MANLPEEVLSNIFVRLRAKQLLQMRCLSRSWKSLLSESWIIKSHLGHSVNNNDGTLLVWSKLDSITALAHPSQSPHLEEVNDSIKLPAIPQSKDSRCRVIGSVHGLICFEYGSLVNSNANKPWSPYQFKSVVYIWNPSLSTMICLPTYYVISDSINCMKNNCFRFGFDPQTDDYKVVHLAESYNPRGLVKLQIEVYSMRKGSWELINEKIPSHVKWVEDKDQMCVDGHDGHLHWLARGWDRVESILAFDLGAETFREIPLPDSIQIFKDNSIYLGVLMGKLCVMSAFKKRGECEVWVMDESWVKYHVFPSFFGNMIPYGFTLHNEFLYRVYPNGFALYNPVAATTKLSKLHGGYDRIERVVEYVDSLVWVTPAK